MNIILRRKGLGKESCEGVAKYLKNTKVRVIDNEVDKDFVFRWGSTQNVVAGVKIINKAASIHSVFDKKEFRFKLKEAGLPVPKEYLLTHIFSDSDYPVIIRPETHSKGNKLFFCENIEQVIHAIGECSPNPYISKYIPKDKEFRIYVIQDRIACVAEKFPANSASIAWNLALGGTTKNVKWGEWPLKACKLAINAMKEAKLDFGGVDIIQKDNDFFILEINSAPTLTSEYRQKCFARCFSYIIQTAGVPFPPLPTAPGGYTKFIHPAIRMEANVLSYFKES